ncbi:MAG TPA: division plane positioning ATPase MipZ [Caulobacteraceae bacterium]|nr:division plane positioning ATPase MipZ [Caulobacteraceae bacterium]
MSQARVIVFGNEKGGAGKTTIALHLITALLHEGAKVATIDLDLRQQSLAHFFASRRAWSASAGVELPMPSASIAAAGLALSKASAAEAPAMFDDLFNTAASEADYLVIDTPGGDTALSRTAHSRADLIVTPMNDSFVDFDLLGQVDPVTLDLVRPSLYSETVWESRKLRMAHDRASIDWVVLRNRLATTEARNRRRVEERMVALARRVGFRISPGLRDRVIYRELFPFGLTVADLSPGVRPVPVALSHVAARQELRALIEELGLPLFPSRMRAAS